MIELSENWKTYYETTDPVKRQEMYEGLIQESGEEYAFAGELFSRRHMEKNKPLNELDKYLYTCIVFTSFIKGGIFSKGNNRKEAKKQLEKMGVYLADNELKETLLYWEMRNAIKRYYGTCSSDTYRRKFLGMMKASDTERKYYMRKDTWAMSLGLTERLGPIDGIEIWTKAVIDEYDSLPNCSASEILNITDDEKRD